MTRLKWKLDLGRLERVLILTQDRCTVCVECTKGLEIILDTPDGSPSVSVECKIGARFRVKRTIGIEIVLNATDVTPR